MREVILYNPRNGSSIKGFRWENNLWEDLLVNEMRSYPEQIANELLKRFEFLVEISPEKVADTTELMSKEILTCEVRGCDFTTTEEKRMVGHRLGKHKMSEESKKLMDAVPSSKGRVVSNGIGVKTPQLSPEQIEGIPDTSKGEVDGWYGAGLEKDNPKSMGIAKPGAAGRFGAA